MDSPLRYKGAENLVEKGKAERDRVFYGGIRHA
jgi:hypothetical protein